MRTEHSAGNYSALIKKVDEFIRKYYLNMVVRGIIYLAAALFISYILVTIAEYYGNFDQLVRSLLFFSFLFLNVSIAIRTIAVPLLSYFKLGKTISHEQASEIIGKHFSHIEDKLINTLQLKKLADENQHQRALIEAGINQKIADLSPIPFTSAINISENRRYLRFVIPPLTVIVLIALTAPSILSEGTERIIHYNKKYVKKAPFTFHLLNGKLQAVQGEDLTLRVKITGNEIPQDVYLEDGINSFKLDRENIILFNYTFRNLQKNKTFRLSGGGFHSAPFEIEVKKRPSLIDFNVRLHYPSYLERKAESLHNAGDLTVPEGTRITWTFSTENTNLIHFKTDSIVSELRPTSGNSFVHTLTAKKNAGIVIRPVNDEVKNNLSVSYNLNVIPDLRPSIEVSGQIDSINHNSFYFIGKISDDHGFSGVKFNYKLSDGKSEKYQSENIPVNKNSTESSFFHTWNIKGTGLKPGQEIEYFFEVFDNDGFNGPKSTRSEIKTFKLDTEEEIVRKSEKSAESIKNKMEQAIRQARSIEKEAVKMNKDLLSKRSLSFDEKSQIENLLNKQEKLEKLVNEIKKENKENLLRQNELDQKQEIIAKQKQIENLFNNVLDDKTKDLLKNIQQLLEQNSKIQTQQELSKMQMDDKSLQKELDRILELYKKLEFDQKLSSTINKLKNLSEKQEELGRKTSQEKNDIRKSGETQDQLKEEFSSIRKDLDELEKKHQNLETMNDFKNDQSAQQEIEQSQETVTKSLRNKNKEKASENMQKASSQMKKMAKKLEDAQQENETQEAGINLMNLRQILANLLKSSFNQEDVLLQVRNTSYSEPSFKNIVQKQKEILDNMKMIQDSLYSLSRRVPQIESFVNKEVQLINSNVDKAIQNLSDRKIPEAGRDQQYALTSINNLALMLSEVEDKVQKAMKSARQGGEGKQKSISGLSKMQEQLNQNMQKAREQMRQQGLKEGQAAGKGEMSEQMAKMARQQQMIREALQQINKELQKDAKGELENFGKVSKEMEQTETDLVNKKLKQETLLRQQQILTKLLEAEKAERERETDNQRESREGTVHSPVYNSLLENFKKIKHRETELLKTVPASLSLFYQLKVGDYFRNLESK